MNVRFIILTITLIIFFMSKACHEAQLVSPYNMPLEMTEHILLQTISDFNKFSPSSLAHLSKLSLVDTNFFTLINDPQGQVQKKLQTLFRTMWHKSDYTSLTHILNTVPPQHMFYKTLCTSLQDQYIDKEYIEGMTELFKERRTLSIHNVLAEALDESILHQTIVIITVHKRMMFEHNICNNEVNDEYIEHLVKQLTTLYPYYMKSLFNKALLFLIGYVAERQRRLNKQENLLECTEVKTWIKLFTQILVH